MNRDPNNQDCTRDPIYLLQVGSRKWTQLPDGLASDGESLWVDDVDAVADWIKSYIAEDKSIDMTDEFWREAESLENDHGWPLVYVEWHTESVFLERPEAETYAEQRAYRWERWRVYCVPCEGELAKILNAYQPASVAGDIAIVSRKFGPLVISGCEEHSNRTDLSCVGIRDASGRKLLTAEVWDVLQELAAVDGDNP